SLIFEFDPSYGPLVVFALVWGTGVVAVMALPINWLSRMLLATPVSIIFFAFTVALAITVGVRSAEAFYCHKGPGDLEGPTLVTNAVFAPQLEAQDPELVRHLREAMAAKQLFQITQIVDRYAFVDAGAAGKTCVAPLKWIVVDRSMILGAQYSLISGTR